MKTTTALIATLLLATSVARAAEGGGGRENYLRYCGACHGPEGKGDGIAGTFMTPKPTDLTQIAKRNGGEYPFARILKVIDGRETVRAHGDPQMPVWGEIFAAEPTWEMTRRSEIQAKTTAITEYVRSIQAK
jgi:mono/diheme cytochrome c family protein